MKSYLSGMPECKFGINDKIVMDSKVAQKFLKLQSSRDAAQHMFKLMHFCRGSPLRSQRASLPLLSTIASSTSESTLFQVKTFSNLFLCDFRLPELLRCVKLSKFETEHAISFIPPDGEHELMR